jgi:hypothetical protein
MRFEDSARAFTARFPDGGLERCDFRPHFEGFAVNAWSAMLPARTEAATRETFRALADSYPGQDRLQPLLDFAAALGLSGEQKREALLRLADSLGLPAELVKKLKRLLERQ